MTEAEILESLEGVVAQLGVELRYEKGDFASGRCRVGEKEMLIINAAMPAEYRITLLVRELAKLDTSAVTMPPKIRDLIESAAAKMEDK